MLSSHLGTLQDFGPSVGKGGYSDGASVVLSSHVLVAQLGGGVNMVVSAARAAVPPWSRLFDDMFAMPLPSASNMTYEGEGPVPFLWWLLRSGLAAYRPRCMMK